jgi:mannonate dehydratase
MLQTWRWFGPVDPVRLSDIRQAGATGVVTALHHLPAGVVWPAEEIAKRITELGADGGAPLPWSVVESLPVSEAIRTRTGDWRAHLDAWRASLEALAAADIRTICYNFMPVLDWTRTDLAAPMVHGGTAMAFDIDTFAAFDIHILDRPGAREDYAPDTAARADGIAAGMDDAARAALTENITCGLPGSTETWSLDALREGLARYADISSERLMQHHVDFLSEVIPTAERLGMRLCCHPDDPPFPLLGLPRVMSTAAHYRELLTAVDSPAAGMTLCTGSLGARPDNDLPAIAREFGPRIHFVHLRNVTRATETVPCSFFEDEHLSGQADMVAVIEALLAEEARRRAEGRADADIPFRPDHGQAILTDLERKHQPGYPAVGRLKGLAELRGVIAALTRPAAAL